VIEFLVWLGICAAMFAASEWLRPPYEILYEKTYPEAPKPRSCDYCGRPPGRAKSCDGCGAPAPGPDAAILAAIERNSRRLREILM
jgi:hypothetical protein